MSKRKLVQNFEENSSESLEMLKDILFIAEVASGPMFRKMIVLHMAIQNFVFGIKNPVSEDISNFFEEFTVDFLLKGM